MKVPFIQEYLFIFNKNHEEINRIKNENKCRLMPYTKIKYIKDFNLINYDYIVIFEKQQFESLITDDLSLYEKLKECKKILFMCTYETFYCKIKECIKNIMYGIKINFDKIKIRKNIPNTTIFLHFNNEKNNDNKINKFLNYLPSSIKIIDINLRTTNKIKGNNFPNKIISFNIKIENLNLNKKIKLPMKSIYISQISNIDIKIFNNLISIFKNKKALVIHNIKSDETKISANKTLQINLITFNKNKYNFMTNIYKYRKNNYSNETSICDYEKKVIKTNDNKLLSKIICYSFSMLDNQIYFHIGNILFKNNSVLTLITSENMMTILKKDNIINQLNIRLYFLTISVDILLNNKNNKTLINY
jgi:hypothetical protein